MALSRRVDRQAINLTRQGALGVFASSHGQEAAQVGSVFALEADDWLFPTYRETVGTFARGVDVVELLALFSGSWHCGFDPYQYRVAPLTTPLATQALHAVGLAMAARIKHDPIVALTFFGDGAASEGDAHEALNMAAVYGAPVVFVVQNNGYAISVPYRLQTKTSSIALRAAGVGMPGIRVDGNDVISVYGAVKTAVDRARRGDGPTLIEAVTYRLEAHTTADDTTPVSQRRRGRPSGARAIRSSGFLRRAARGRRRRRRVPRGGRRRRRGDRRAHARLSLRRSGRRSARDVRPRVRDADAAARGSARDARAGIAGGRGELMELTMAGALNAALRDSMREDDTVVVYGEDVGRLGGVFRITDGLQAEMGTDRCFDTPVAESGIAGTAIGMALYGLRPVVEMQFDGFSYPALNQVISHVAKYRNRTRGRVGLPMVIRIPYGGGIGAVEHHSESPEAYYAHTAGLTVVSPGTPADAYALLRASIAFDDPVIFLEPKRRYWLKEDLDLPVTAPPIGEAVVRRAGTTATVIAYGPMVTTAMEAATRAADESGWDLEVVDVRTLSPVDMDTLVASATKTGTGARGPRGGAIRRLRRGDRRGVERARLRLPRGAGAARHRVRRPVSVGQDRAPLPSRRRPHPRRRRATARVLIDADDSRLPHARPRRGAHRGRDQPLAGGRG